MIANLYDQITGLSSVDLLLATDFDSLESLQVECARRSKPTLVVVSPNQIDNVLRSIDQRHDVCLDTAPDSLIQYRLQRLMSTSFDAHDSLTGLLSRQSLERAMECLLADAPPDLPLSLIFCDTDRFKQINDTHGHSVGDEVLRVIADCLLAACGPDDLISRHGGEEFAILSQRDRESATRLAQQICHDVANHFADKLHVTISMGVASSQGNRVSQLFSQADEAMYCAKASGRNRVVHFATMQVASDNSQQDTSLIGLENRARVLTERVTSFITLRSRNLVNLARIEANTDGLTQFYTRRYLDRRLASEASIADNTMSLAMVDLDHFGLVNKKHGWPTGDKVLRDVCDVIRVQIRETDWVGRYGGEEFCIVMRDTRLAEATVILERLRQTVENELFCSTSNEQVPMTLSIGLIESMSNQCPMEMLERVSQQALRAKNSGRNRVCVEASAVG